MKIVWCRKTKKIVYFLIYDVFKDAASNLDSILVASNCRTICENRLRRQVDANSSDAFQDIISLIVWTDWRNPPKYLIQDRRCPEWESNPLSPEYNSEELPFVIICLVHYNKRNRYLKNRLKFQIQTQTFLFGLTFCTFCKQRDAYSKDLIYGI